MTPFINTKNLVGDAKDPDMGAYGNKLPVVNGAVMRASIGLNNTKNYLSGVSQYQRTAKGPPARGSSPQANTQNVKGMQMKALQSAYKPTGPTSNGKGVGP